MRIPERNRVRTKEERTKESERKSLSKVEVKENETGVVRSE